MKRIPASLFVCAVILIGCAQVPQWVKSGSSSSHPDERFIVAIREGDTPASAKKSCQAAIRAFIEREAGRAESPLSQFRSSLERGQKAVVEPFLKGTQAALEQATGDVMEGLQIVETWRDPVSAKVSALAVIKRARAGEMIRSKLESIGKDIMSALSAADSAQDPRAKTKALREALSSFLSHEVWNTLLFSVDPSGKGISAPVSSDVIIQKIKDAGTTLKIALEVTGVGSASVKDSIEGQIIDKGFEVVSADPDVIVRVFVEASVQKSEKPPETVTVYRRTEETTAAGVEAHHKETIEVPSQEAPSPGSNIVFISWKTTISLEEARTRKGLKRLIERGRDGQPIEEEAWEEAIAHMSRAVVEKCTPALVDFISKP